MSRLAFRWAGWLATLLVGVSASAVACGVPPGSGPIAVPVPALPAHAPEGYVVSAYSAGDSWYVLDPSSGRYEQTTFQVNAVSPNLQYALVADHVDRAGVLDTTTRKVIRWFGSTFVVPLGWSPDGRWIALGNAIREGCKTDCDFVDRIRFVDVATGEHRDVSTPRQLLTFFQAPRPWTTDGKILVHQYLIGADGTVKPIPVDVAAGLPVLGTDNVTLLHADGPVAAVQVDLRTGHRTPGRRLDSRCVDTARIQAWLNPTEAIVTTGNAELAALQITTCTTRPLARLPRRAVQLRIQHRTHVADGAIVF